MLELLLLDFTFLVSCAPPSKLSRGRFRFLRVLFTFTLDGLGEETEVEA